MYGSFYYLFKLSAVTLEIGLHFNEFPPTAFDKYFGVAQQYQGQKSCRDKA